MIRPTDAPAGLEMPETPGAEAIVLPRETDEGIGLYDDSVVTLVKELREAGASSEYLHEPQSRSWIGEKGVDPVILNLIIGIAGNAGWDALCAVLKRRGKKPVAVKVARHVDEESGRSWEWIEVEGEGDAVAAALRSWRGEDPGDADDGEEEQARRADP